MRLIKKCIALTISAALASMSFNCFAKTDFQDLQSDHKAYTAVMSLVEKGIINGVSDSHFAPDDFLKREELAKIAVLTIKKDLSDKTSSFTDVVVSSWYEPYVATAFEAGLIKGISDTKFGTGTLLTKQDSAVIIHRLLGIKGITLKSDKTVLFADDSEISDYAKEAITALASSDIITADENNCFHPTDSITRSELCIMLYNALAKENSSAFVDKANVKGSSIFNPPYTHITGDRVAAEMPKAFSSENHDIKYDLVFDDFEEGNNGQKTNWVFTSGVALQSEVAYSGKRSVCISKTPSVKIERMDGRYKENVVPGGFYSLECMMTTDGVNGVPVLALEVYNSNGKYLVESNVGNHVEVGTNGVWKKYSLVLSVPAEGAELNMLAYMNTPDSQGKIYVDDMKLSRLIFEPMRTVLLTPSYKGLIYGDGGIGDINMKIIMDEAGGYYDFSKMVFHSQIVDKDNNVLRKAETDNISKVMNISFSSDGLEIGDYYLESYLTKKETGEKVYQDNWVIRKRDKDYRPKFYVDDYGRLVKNGKPIFEIILMGATSSDQEFKDLIDYALEAPVDTIADYNVKWWLSNDRDNYIKMIEENNKQMQLKASFLFLGYNGMEEITSRIKSGEDLRSFLKIFVDKFKDRNVLWGYNIMDEQDPLVHEKAFNWTKMILDDMDIDRPSEGIADVIYDYGTFTKWLDILSIDPYPILGHEEDRIEKITNMLRHYKNGAFPNRPMFLTTQWVSRCDSMAMKVGAVRGPNIDELRNITWQGICEGVMGIEAYCHQRWYLDSKITYEDWTNMYTTIHKEVQFFEPVILSVEPAPYYEAKAGDWLNIMAKRHEGKSYLFMVNHSKDQKNAKVKLENVTSITGMFSGKSYEADHNGYFDIEMDSLEVEVFKFDQVDYLSPEAKLLSFGLCGDDTSYIAANEDEEPVITSFQGLPGYVSFERIPRVRNYKDNAFILSLPKDVEALNYGAKISDKAKLYINDKEVSTSGTVDIKGVDKIAVRVVSEDKRFSTERIYKINRQDK